MKVQKFHKEAMDRVKKHAQEELNARSPRIEIAWGSTADPQSMGSKWIDLAGKSLEEVQEIIDSIPGAVIFDTEGFGDWEGMEDEPIETIMEAAQLILELGSPDEYFKVGL